MDQNQSADAQTIFYIETENYYLYILTCQKRKENQIPDCRASQKIPEDRISVKVAQGTRDRREDVAHHAPNQEAEPAQDHAQNQERPEDHAEAEDLHALPAEAEILVVSKKEAKVAHQAVLNAVEAKEVTGQAKVALEVILIAEVATEVKDHARLEAMNAVILAIDMANEVQAAHPDAPEKVLAHLAGIVDLQVHHMEAEKSDSAATQVLKEANLARTQERNKNAEMKLPEGVPGKAEVGNLTLLQDARKECLRHLPMVVLYA